MTPKRLLRQDAEMGFGASAADTLALLDALEAAENDSEVEL